jgi:hypothetical protein
MNGFENENIIKLTFNRLALFRTKQLFQQIKNNTLCKVILNMITYEQIFKSMGKNKSILTGHNYLIADIALLPNNQIITASRDEILKIWDLNTKECIKTLKEDKKQAIKSLITLTGDYIAYCTRDSDKLLIRSIENDFEIVNTFQWDKHKYLDHPLLIPNGSLVLYSGFKNEYLIIITIWNYNSDCYSYKHIRLGNNGLTCLITFTDNNVACCTENGIIQIYDCEKFTRLKTLYGHSNKINSIAYNSKRNILLSGAIDGDIKVWDMLCHKCVRTIRLNYLEGVDCLLMLPNGYFAFVSVNIKIQIWDLDKYQCINEFEIHKDSVTRRLEILKDNRLLCISENQIILWDY